MVSVTKAIAKPAIIVVVTAGMLLTTQELIAGGNDGQQSPPPEATPPPIVLHEETILSELRSKARIVAPTGDVEKTIVYEDENFFGQRHYKMTVRGQFILGIPTSEIDIDVVGNTLKVRLPQPEIVSLDLPYDQMTLTESKSFLRKELPEAEKKALYTKAEEIVVNEINSDNETQETAEDQVEEAVSGLLLKINGVEHVMFVE